MAEYIEREAASRVMCDACGNAACPKGLIPRCSYYEKMQSIPAADVRPVVKAKWVYTDMSRLVCSNCGNPVAFALKEDGWHHGDYCSNCGARMEES